MGRCCVPLGTFLLYQHFDILTDASYQIEQVFRASCKKLWKKVVGAFPIVLLSKDIIVMPVQKKYMSITL